MDTKMRETKSKKFLKDYKALIKDFVASKFAEGRFGNIEGDEILIRI